MAHALVVDQGTDLGSLHVAHALDGCGRSLRVQVAKDGLRQVELIEGMLVWPHPLFDTLAHTEQHQALITPTPVKRDHEQRTADSGSVLSDVCGVGDQGEVFRSSFADVGLQQDIGLTLLGSNTAVDVARSVFLQSHKLLLFGVPRCDVVELSRHGNHLQHVCFGRTRLHHGVEDLHTCLQNVERTGDSSNVLCAQLLGCFVEDDHLTLLQDAGGIDNQLTTTLHQRRIVSDFRPVDAIGHRVLAHAHDEIRVS